ncbi:hypothetical protein CBR_g4016 [Chara braunii]|uniref:CRM domain-containing protein n=1 Tax=Chara braunii TaxID=69332 RepID=A0A388KGZ9_CHABU|nr:hypothetical protein CBR_g4016 [Chara braunii]|eukprot:GBG69319.1 hypothetical protein CBR_g4016 [Chara braunii]
MAAIVTQLATPVSSQLAAEAYGRGLAGSPRGTASLLAHDGETRAAIDIGNLRGSSDSYGGSWRRRKGRSKLSGPAMVGRSTCSSVLTSATFLLYRTPRVCPSCRGVLANENRCPRGALEGVVIAGACWTSSSSRSLDRNSLYAIDASFCSSSTNPRLQNPFKPPVSSWSLTPLPPSFAGKLLAPFNSHFASSLTLIDGTGHALWPRCRLNNKPASPAVGAQFGRDECQLWPGRHGDRLPDGDPGGERSLGGSPTALRSLAGSTSGGVGESVVEGDDSPGAPAEEGERWGGAGDRATRKRFGGAEVGRGGDGGEGEGGGQQRPAGNRWRGEVWRSQAGGRRSSSWTAREGSLDGERTVERSSYRGRRGEAGSSSARSGYADDRPPGSRTPGEGRSRQGRASEMPIKVSDKRGGGAAAEGSDGHVARPPGSPEWWYPDAPPSSAAAAISRSRGNAPDGRRNVLDGRGNAPSGRWYAPDVRGSAPDGSRTARGSVSPFPPPRLQNRESRFPAGRDNKSETRGDAWSGSDGWRSRSDSRTSAATGGGSPWKGFYEGPTSDRSRSAGSRGLRFVKDNEREWESGGGGGDRQDSVEGGGGRGWKQRARAPPSPSSSWSSRGDRTSTGERSNLVGTARPIGPADRSWKREEGTRDMPRNRHLSERDTLDPPADRTWSAGSRFSDDEREWEGGGGGWKERTRTSSPSPSSSWSSGGGRTSTGERNNLVETARPTGPADRSWKREEGTRDMPRNRRLSDRDTLDPPADGTWSTGSRFSNNEREWEGGGGRWKERERTSSPSPSSSWSSRGGRTSMVGERDIVESGPEVGPADGTWNREEGDTGGMPRNRLSLSARLKMIADGKVFEEEEGGGGLRSKRNLWESGPIAGPGSADGTWNRGGTVEMGRNRMPLSARLKRIADGAFLEEGEGGEGEGGDGIVISKAFMGVTREDVRSGSRATSSSYGPDQAGGGERITSPKSHKPSLWRQSGTLSPPSWTKAVKQMDPPGPFLGAKSLSLKRKRDQLGVQGEPLTPEEVKELVKDSLTFGNRQVNLGRDGLTHNMVDNVHTHWKRRRVCKIKCKGVPTVDMEGLCKELEEKTGGKVIYRAGGVVFLFRGRYYDYRARPKIEIKHWKDPAPKFPPLIVSAPGGLTKLQAYHMRKLGLKLEALCRLNKNGVYADLVKKVQWAFQTNELLRINAKGLNKSDYKKIGARLRHLVPCILLSFKNENIIIWRGVDWKSPKERAAEVAAAAAAAAAADGATTADWEITGPIGGTDAEGVDNAEAQTRSEDEDGNGRGNQELWDAVMADAELCDAVEMMEGSDDDDDLGDNSGGGEGSDDDEEEFDEEFEEELEGYGDDLETGERSDSGDTDSKSGANEQSKGVLGQLNDGSADREDDDPEESDAGLVIQNDEPEPDPVPDPESEADFEPQSDSQPEQSVSGSSQLEC